MDPRDLPSLSQPLSPMEGFGSYETSRPYASVTHFVTLPLYETRSSAVILRHDMSLNHIRV